MPTVLAFALAIVATSAPPRGEPPIRLVITLDGKQYEAVEGQAIEVALGGQTAKLEIAMLPTRRFEAAGIAFDYPRHMSWEHEADIGFELWTLDGSAVTVMVQRYVAGDPDDLAALVLREGAKTVGHRRVETEDVEISLGGKKLRGRHATVTIADIPQRWTVVGIEVGGKPIVLWLQDMLDDDNQATEEMKHVLELLAKTFRGN